MIREIRKSNTEKIVISKSEYRGNERVNYPRLKTEA